jgi:hypothetical protein
MMVQRTFSYQLVGRVHVAVHGAAPPSDEEWHEYLEHIGAHLDRVDALYSFTSGGGPDGAQRRYAVEFWKHKPKQPPIAVVTPSLLVVRMAGALRWFMPTQIKAFLPSQMTAACDYLRLTSEQRRSVERVLVELAAPPIGAAE